MSFEIKPITNIEQLKNLDFTDDGNIDPLGVNEFAHSKASSYHKNKISTIWGVTLNGKLVGFSAVSMFSIQTKKLETNEHVVDTSSIYSYLAMLLGQLGTDRNHRKNGIGGMMVEFCVGLAQEIGERIACRYVVLQTDQSKTKLYADKKFVPSSKAPSDGKVWMYRRIA